MTAPVPELPAERASWVRVVAELEARDLVARRRGDSKLEARCPVHDDGRASMTVDWFPADAQRAGRVLVCCHVCGPERTPDIVAALGLAGRDLYDGPPPGGSRRPMPRPARGRPASAPARPAAGRPACKHAWERVAAYPYTDEAGELLNRVIRKECRACREKDIRPERAWPGRRPVYRLPAVLATIRAGRMVYVVEGEKDADAIDAAGECATTNPFGAGKWLPEHTAALAGAVRVVVVADRDAPGYRHAAMVAAELRAAEGGPAAVEVAESASGKDASDHLAAGLGLGALVPIDPAARLAELEAAADPAAPGFRDSDRAAAADSAGSRKPAAAPVTDLRSRLRPVDAPAELGEPAYPVPVSAGLWAYSLGDGSDGHDRGLYKFAPETTSWRLLAPLPHGHARIIRRDGSGRADAVDYLISAAEDGPRHIVGHLKLRDGSWANELGVPLSDDPKVIQAAGSAIRAMMHADDVAEREAIPRPGADGLVAAPVPECLPAGYLARAPGTARAALEVWRQLAEIAAGSPKLADVIGASVIAPFMGPSRQQSHWLELYGEPGQGKTTGLYLGAAVWGDPDHTAGRWNSTGIGMGRQLGALGILPAFMDEAGMAGYTPQQWGDLIFRTCEGNIRTTAEQKGTGTRRSLPWHGILLTSGNGRVTAGLAAGRYSGLARRVISVASPFTSHAAEAELIAELIRAAYGHLGAAVLADWSVPAAAGLIDQAAGLLELPEASVPRSLARSLHAHIAGAMITDQILGTGDALAAAVLAFARAYMAEHAGGPEHDADRLIAAVREAMAREPSRWPTVTEYREHRQARPDYLQGARDPARVELPQHGVARDLAGVREDSGKWVAVFSEPFGRELCDPLGIDQSVALAELHRRGVLKVAPSVRAAGVWQTPVPPMGRMYKLALPDEDAEDAPSHEGSGADSPVIPVTQQVRAPSPPVTAPVTAPVTPAPGGPQERARGEFAGSAVVADADGAWLAGPGAPVLIELPPGLEDLAGLLEWAAGLGLGLAREHGRPDDGTVVVMPALAARLGLPASAPEAGTKAARQHAALAPVRSAGWLGVAELRSWMRPYREGGRTLRVWVAGWDTPGECPLLEGGPAAVDLAYRLGRFADLAGITWRLTGGPTGADLAGTFRRRARLVEQPAPPKVALVPTLEPDFLWQRSVSADEAKRLWVHSYDANAMYLAAAGLVTVGLGDPVQLAEPEFDPRVPGYWLVDPPGWSAPLLPDLFDRAGLAAAHQRRGPRWMATPTLALAAELGYPVKPLEALVYRDRSRYYEGWAARLREARAATMAAPGDPDEMAVLGAVKDTYRKGIGLLAVKSSGRMWRPDHRHAIVATAAATLLRKLAAVGEGEGRWPLAINVDAVVYASDDPDPVSAVPAGLRLGTGLGEFKPHGSLPMAEAAPLLTRGGRHPDPLFTAIREAGSHAEA